MQRNGMQNSFPPTPQCATSDLHKINDNKFRTGDKVGNRKNIHEKRSRSSDTRARPVSMMCNMGNMRDRSTDHLTSWSRINNDQFDLAVHNGPDDKKPWFMREPRDLPSLALQSRTDSGIGDELWRSPRHQPRHNSGSSSFGMILKDKFQKNPNMYFPATSSGVSPVTVTDTKCEEEDWSDADTLVHNMSEGSFDKVETIIY